MRTQDEEKKEALFKATIKLVNQIGFVSSSVSKIAKEAGVSPATLYIYYKNKDDLIVSTYISLKIAMSKAMMKGFDDGLPIRDILRQMWLNMFYYIVNHSDYYKFTEQFANSPYSEMVDKESLEKYFGPIHQVFERGIQQKVIKDIDIQILGIYLFYPVMGMAKALGNECVAFTDDMLETLFTLVWDGVKL